MYTHLNRVRYNLAAVQATVAQLVEQTIRNRQVTSSILVGGSGRDL